MDMLSRALRIDLANLAATDPRAALPGPMYHDATVDLTPVLMAMVERAELTPAAAEHIAQARGLNAQHNGAYFTRACAARVVYHGLNWDARAFARTHQGYAALRSYDLASPSTLTTNTADGFGARSEARQWLQVDEMVTWGQPLPDLARKAAGDILWVLGLLGGIVLLAMAFWLGLASAYGAWPFLGH